MPFAARALWYAVALVLVATSLAGCGNDDDPGDSSPGSPDGPAGVDHELTLEFGGVKRTYTVHAPPSFDTAEKLPVVVALHFYPGDGAGMKELTGLDAKADAEGFLVVYPDGVDGGYNGLKCCGSQDDVGFIAALVKSLAKDWKADPARTYATGMSNGAELSYRLAVELPGVFAAIAPVSGGYIGAKTAKDSYVPSEPVSVITFLGETDRFYATFDAGMKLWRKRLGCRPKGEEPPTDGVTSVATRCADGSDVTSYAYAEMEHAWPGASSGMLAAPGLEPAATDAIWEFFKAHPLSS